MASEVKADTPVTQPEIEKKPSSDHVYDAEEKAVGYDRSGAIDAETQEHSMGVWETVKAYPAASWWAVVMSSTIVSSATIRIHRGGSC
jgi:MFS transporter, SP family, general alpha glucoside:H+ symporter